MNVYIENINLNTEFFIIPDTDLNIPVFASGWGDGDYPCYFGYDEKGELCGFYIHFIDIEREYSDED